MFRAWPPIHGPLIPGLHYIDKPSFLHPFLAFLPDREALAKFLPTFHHRFAPLCKKTVLINGIVITDGPHAVFEDFDVPSWLRVLERLEEELVPVSDAAK